MKRRLSRGRRSVRGRTPRHDQRNRQIEPCFMTRCHSPSPTVDRRNPTRPGSSRVTAAEHHRIPPPFPDALSHENRQKPTSPGGGFQQQQRPRHGPRRRCVQDSLAPGPDVIATAPTRAPPQLLPHPAVQARQCVARWMGRPGSSSGTKSQRCRGATPPSRIPSI